MDDKKTGDCIENYNALNDNVTNLGPYNEFVNCARNSLGMGQWKEAYKDADDEMLRKFRASGLNLTKNGLSLRLFPRFKGFMVDYMAAERSKSAVFWHGVKNTDIVEKHWKVQEDDTIFPKCVAIENTLKKLIVEKTSTVSPNSNKSDDQISLGDSTLMELKLLGTDVSHLAAKMDDFKTSSLDLQRALDSSEQQKEKQSILEQMKINENLTMTQLNVLQKEIEASNAEIKPLKLFANRTLETIKEVLENQEAIIAWVKEMNPLGQRQVQNEQRKNNIPIPDLNSDKNIS